jgi:hypothetical protein
MKTPRVHDFDPDAAERKLGTPLDGMPAIQKPVHPVERDRHEAAPTVQNPSTTSLPVTTKQTKSDIFDKYSTYIRPGYKRALKLIALEKDCKDYEVLDEALSLYIDSGKK